MLLALAFLLGGVALEADLKVNGRIVDVMMRVKNPGGMYTMEFPTAQLYELELTPGGMRWSDDRMFAQGRQRRVIPPGVSRFRERWILPPTIKPGDYRLKIWFKHEGPPLEAEVPLTIGKPR